MPKYILIFIFLLSPLATFSQEQIALCDLLNITIRDVNAGLGGAFSIDYEISNKNGKWYCTRKKIDYSGLNVSR